MGSGVADVVGFVAGLNLSPGASAVVAQAANTSWTSMIFPGINPPSFSIDSGRNPMGQANGTVIYEDLYNGAPGGGFIYDGYFTLNMTAGASLTFTPAGALVVPEPSTSGLIACAALLALARKLKRSAAKPVAGSSNQA
jgi:hypothetical protein